MKDACHLVAAWTASRKKWFDFCYRFAVCVKLCYQSRPVLSPHPHGAVTNILATVRPLHPPFPNACSALRAYRLCFPLWSSTLSRFHAGASLAGPPRIISVPSFLLCGHLLVRCSFAIVFIIAIAYHGCAITLLTIILIGASVPYTFFELLTLLRPLSAGLKIHGSKSWLSTTTTTTSTYNHVFHQQSYRSGAIKMATTNAHAHVW
jgi:hypothetical protein